jgi:hypothetical protein
MAPVCARGDVRGRRRLAPGGASAGRAGQRCRGRKLLGLGLACLGAAGSGLPCPGAAGPGLPCPGGLLCPGRRVQGDCRAKAAGPGCCVRGLTARVCRVPGAAEPGLSCGGTVGQDSRLRRTVGPGRPCPGDCRGGLSCSKGCRAEVAVFGGLPADTPVPEGPPSRTPVPERLPAATLCPVAVGPGSVLRDLGARRLRPGYQALGGVSSPGSSGVWGRSCRGGSAGASVSTMWRGISRRRLVRVRQ